MTQVVIGCKLPMGLHIGIGDKSAVLKGSNSSNVIGGYGLTEVDKELADAWFKEYENYQPVKDGLIFVQSSDSNAKAVAKERKAVKSKMEPMEPSEQPGIEAVKD